jgi:hypothetical protein
MEQYEDTQCKIEGGVSKGKLLRVHHRDPPGATRLRNLEHPGRAIDSYDVRIRCTLSQVFKKLARSCADVQDFARLRKRQYLE